MTSCSILNFYLRYEEKRGAGQGSRKMEGALKSFAKILPKSYKNMGNNGEKW